MDATETQLLICKHIDITKLEYNQLVFDTAFDYLNKIIPGDEFGINFLTQSSSFWMWWKSQWQRRELIFIREANLDTANYVLPKSTKELVKELWHETHDIGGLNIHPSRVLMESAYSEMIGEVFKERRTHASGR